MKYLTRFSLAIMTCLIIASCSKTGDTGPAGVTGPAGPSGPAGPIGPIGNANVKVDTFTLTNAQWTVGGTYYVGASSGISNGYFSKYYDYTIPRVTASFMQAGLVLIYFSSEPGINANTYSPLPFSFTIGGSAGYAINLAYENYVGKIRLHFFPSKVYNDAPLIATYPIPTYRFKIITVEGNINGRTGTPPDIHDYKATCRYYGVEE